MTREITIEPVLNGYVCRVGCQRIVFQDRKQMLAEIGKYLEKPDDTEKRYIKDAVNKMPDVPQPCAPTPCNTAREISATEVCRR